MSGRIDWGLILLPTLWTSETKMELGGIGEDYRILVGQDSARKTIGQRQVTTHFPLNTMLGIEARNLKVGG